MLQEMKRWATLLLLLLKESHIVTDLCLQKFSSNFWTCLKTMKIAITWWSSLKFASSKFQAFSTSNRQAWFRENWRISSCTLTTNKIWDWSSRICSSCIKCRIIRKLKFTLSSTNWSRKSKRKRQETGHVSFVMSFDCLLKYLFKYNIKKQSFSSFLHAFAQLFEKPCQKLH